jgi:hypothetical protein
MFVKERFEQPSSKIEPWEPFAWLASAIRQIRIYALSLQQRPGQYCDVLAFHLFDASTRACDADEHKDPQAYNDEDFRRATAYRLVESLVEFDWAKP